MVLTLAQIAQMVNGTLLGDPSILIDGAATLQDATKSQISLARDASHEKAIRKTAAAAIVIPSDHRQVAVSAVTNIPTILVPDVNSAFEKIVHRFEPPTAAPPVEVSPRANVDPTARLSENVHIFPGATVGADCVVGRNCTIHSGVVLEPGCQLGDDVTIFPNAVLYHNTRVGNRCLIHANAVLGSYGFGYESTKEGHKLCAQLGNVVLEDDVEVGAATTVDRGTYGATRIGQGTKLDNHVMIGHNCKIGKHNLMCAHVGIAGSVTTGDFVVMAGQVGVRDHIQIGDHVVLGAKSGVGSDLLEADTYLGAPPLPSRTQMQILFSLPKIPEMRRQIKRLTQLVETLMQDRKSSPIDDNRVNDEIKAA